MQLLPEPDASILTGSIDAESFSDLIGMIYDAALDETRWPDALHRIAAFGAGCGAALFSKNAADRTAAIDYQVGIAPEFQQQYLARYLKMDPGTIRQYLADICEPVCSDDCMPRDEFSQTRFYLELVRPQGLIDFVTCALEKSGASASMFGVFRHERDGVCDEPMRQRMRLIAPHMRRAVLIGQVFDRQLLRAAQLADALDQVKAATFLIGARGEIVHANAAGLAAASAGEVLQGRDGRLVARNREADAALRQAIALAAEGDASIGASGVAIPLAIGTGAQPTASILPLTSGARRRSAGEPRAVAAIFVTERSPDMRAAPELVARAYKLTPSELRVMLAIVEVGGVPEVAEALGVAEGTVRTHLKSLFAKTGARRQADLVKIVAHYAGGRTES